MKRRLVFGPILIAILLGLLALDEFIAGKPVPAALSWCMPTGAAVPSGLVLLVLGMLASGRAGLELARMFNAMGIQASRRHLSAAAAAGVLVGGLAVGSGRASVWGEASGAVLGSAAALVLFLSMVVYVRDKDLKGAAGAVAAAVFSFVYMGVVLGFLMAIRREHSVWVMAAVVMVVKMCDSGAYFTGTAIGKHKLIPWVSPGKTWEGLIGGVLTGAGFAMLFVLAGRQWGGWGHGWLASMELWQAGLLGLLLGAVGQLGDLSASIIKRDAGVKDAGRILPGFGGMVDMLDSLVIASPAAYWAFVWIRQIS